MTTKETAAALGVTERTVQRRASELGLTVNGQVTNLDETAVTLIKKMIEKSGRNDLDNVVELTNVSTDLEMMILDVKVSEWKTRRISDLQTQLAESERKLTIAAPKADVYDDFVSRGNFRNFRDAAATIGITQTCFMDFLRTKYIYKNNFQEYRAYGDYQIYFSLRPFPRGGRTGNQLMLTIDGVAFFKKLITGEKKNG